MGFVCSRCCRFCWVQKSFVHSISFKMMNTVGGPTLKVDVVLGNVTCNAEDNCCHFFLFHTDTIQDVARVLSCLSWMQGGSQSRCYYTTSCLWLIRFTATTFEVLKQLLIRGIREPQTTVKIREVGVDPSCGAVVIFVSHSYGVRILLWRNCGGLSNVTSYYSST